MNRLTVASSQIGYRFGDQLYYPYSIAALVSYVSQFDAIKASYAFLPCLVEREQMGDYLERYGEADILLCSCYLWNVEATKRLMREFRKRNPNVLIIAGGPQPQDTADITVKGEGELPLTKILWDRVSGRDVDAASTARLNNLDVVPSPYLDGTMHRLVDPAAAKWVATWETVRGCPYRCGYCAWGDPAHNDMRKLADERLNKEIDWFSQNQIGYIECADSNFGSFARDEDIAESVAWAKEVYGYPQVFKVSWAKHISPRVFRIARTLNRAGLLLSAGCSLQSLETQALKEVGRVSVAFDDFKSVIYGFKQDGIHTFTELIRGLPGETVDSFREGLNKVIFESNVDTVYVYNCTVLDGTALADRKDLETVRSPLYLAHACVSENEEYENIVVASSTFSRDGIKEMYLYSWYMLAFQHLGILNYVTRYLVRERGITYMEFWLRFKEYCERHPEGLFGREYATARQYIEDGYSGRGWGYVDAALGPITWPLDEATWLRVTWKHGELRQEIEAFLTYEFGIFNPGLALARFQAFMLSNRNDRAKQVSATFQLDWLRYFKGDKLWTGPVTYTRDNKITQWQDDFDWSRQAIWYGRRKLAYKANLGEVWEQLGDIGPVNASVLPAARGS